MFIQYHILQVEYQPMAGGDKRRNPQPKPVQPFPPEEKGLTLMKKIV
ncbi:hypothetical protein B4135_1559 [Caldibacillus debilis]|uniref:Uncharacterized protein n=1 Tax=Caldibacillus debilis TaxID=301148 RepID=A0A150MBL3_9BACI|nr:hypothetical protein B4135_1559 [Caldibacillus debilis]